MHVLDIPCLSGLLCFTVEHWWDVGTASFNALLAAGLGIVGAFALYRRQITNDREDLLRFAALMMRAVIEKISKQARHCQEYAKRDIAGSSSVPLLTMLTHGELIRLVDRLDHIKLYNAFINRFGRTTDVRQNYGKLYTTLDYTNAVLLQMTHYLEKELKSLVEKKHRYIAELHQAEERMMHVAGDSTNPEVLKEFFIKKGNDFIEVKKDRKLNDNLKYGMESFADPILKFLLDNHFLEVPGCEEIAFSIRRAGMNFDIIEQQSEGLAENFNEYAEQLNTAIVRLESASKHLLEAYPDEKPLPSDDV